MSPLERHIGGGDAGKWNRLAIMAQGGPSASSKVAEFFAEVSPEEIASLQRTNTALLGEVKRIALRFEIPTEGLFPARRTPKTTSTP